MIFYFIYEKKETQKLCDLSKISDVVSSYVERVELDINLLILCLLLFPNHLTGSTNHNPSNTEVSFEL